MEWLSYHSNATSTYVDIRYYSVPFFELYFLLPRMTSDKTLSTVYRVREGEHLPGQVLSLSNGLFHMLKIPGYFVVFLGAILHQ